VRVRINRYVITEIFGPMGLGFLVYTFILLLRFLFQSAEMIIRRGLPVSVVGKLLLVTLPNIVVLTLPMSLLFGILIAVGRLSSDSELTAMRSCGISLASLYRPVLLVSGVFTILNALLMIYVLPWGNHALQELRLEILTQTMSQQVEPRVFYQEWVGKSIYVFEAPPPGRRWKGVFLAETDPNTTKSQITVADWGEIKVDPTGEHVVLSLTNAVRHTVDLNRPSSYEISRHKELSVVLEDQFTSEQKAKMAASKGVRELSMAELRRLNRNRNAPSEARNLALVELHKKFSIPFACMVFGLFALPLGINNRRGGKTSGFAISIGIIVVYYIMLNNGEEGARFGKFPPWLAMWMPNILLAVIGIFILIRRNADKGLLIGRLDRWVRTDLWSRLARLKRKRPEPRQERPPGEERRQRARAPATGRRLLLRLPRLRITFPSLLDRYVASAFARVFVLVLLSGVTIFVIFDLTERLDDIIKNKVALSVVVKYYKYLSIQIVYQISPIVVLVTTLMTFALLSRTSEIVACKALGISLYRLSLPALVAALLITGFSGYLESGKILAAANEKVAQTKDRIQGRTETRSYRRADRQWLFGQGRYIYNYLNYDSGTTSLQRLQVFDFDPAHHLIRRLFTEKASYVGDAWVFTKGWARTFGGNFRIRYEPFDQPRIVRYPETPAYFNSEIKPPDEMGYHELQDYIDEMAESGQPEPELLVNLYQKVAYPVISLVMALVALPFAFRLGRQGALYGIGLSVILGFVFMAIYAFFTKIGEAGALPALIAVWSPGTVFGILSVYLFLGVRT
jgi:LPS export ABC transporter permease LptF/LPS export ABC transporter permease LptG